MTTVIKHIMNWLGTILSFVLPSNYPDLIDACRSHFNTGFHKRYFYHWGKASLLGYNSGLYGTKHISIGNNTVFLPNNRIAAYPSKASESPIIKIGDNCHFGSFSHITAINSITIGDNVLTGSYVLISDNSHGDSQADTLTISPLKRPLVSSGSVLIGSNVWIGDKVCILPNVKIGQCSIIGAGSIVTHDIPEYSVAAGNPARVIKKLK